MLTYDPMGADAVASDLAAWRESRSASPAADRVRHALGMAGQVEPKPRMRPAIGARPVFIAMDDRRPGEKMAAWDGLPKRAPRAGELYLSGAVVVAYRARADLADAYWIARPVTT